MQLPGLPFRVFTYIYFKTLLKQIFLQVTITYPFLPYQCIATATTTTPVIIPIHQPSYTATLIGTHSTFTSPVYRNALANFPSPIPHTQNGITHLRTTAARIRLGRRARRIEQIQRCSTRSVS